MSNRELLEKIKDNTERLKTDNFIILNGIFDKNDFKNELKLFLEFFLIAFFIISMWRINIKLENIEKALEEINSRIETVAFDDGEVTE